VASVCRAIKLGSEGRGARHKKKTFFPHKVWVIRMLKGGMSDVQDVSRECGIQVIWSIIVGPALGKIQKHKDSGIKFYLKDKHHLCNLYGRLTFHLCAKIKPLSANTVDDVKI
jgi:hypothetical protein